MRTKVNDLPLLEVHEWSYAGSRFFVRDYELFHSIVVDFPDFHSIRVEVFHVNEIIPRNQHINEMKTLLI